MIDTNSTVFKFASCAACTVMAVLATLLVSNKYYRNGFFNFAKTPVSQNANVSQNGNTSADQTRAGDKKSAPAAPKEDEFVEFARGDVIANEQTGEAKPGFTKKTENGETYYVQNSTNKRVKFR